MAPTRPEPERPEHPVPFHFFSAYILRSSAVVFTKCVLLFLPRGRLRHNQIFRRDDYTIAPFTTPSVSLCVFSLF